MQNLKIMNKAIFLLLIASTVGSLNAQDKSVYYD